MRILVAAAALIAAPAVAQSPSAGPVQPPAVADAVDPALVGAWTLDEVVEGGQLAALGVDVEAMECAFGAEGTARVEMAMVQDADPIVRERTFTFQTADGQIVVPDDDDVTYRLLDDGRLEMETFGGLVVRFVRSRR